MAHGIYQEISGSDAKKYLHEFALGIKELILRKEERSLSSIGHFSSKIYTNNPSIIFKISVVEITGKKRIYSEKKER